MPLAPPKACGTTTQLEVGGLPQLGIDAVVVSVELSMNPSVVLPQKTFDRPCRS